MNHLLGPRSLINFVCLIVLLLLLLISDWCRQQPYLGFNVVKTISNQLAVNHVENGLLMNNLHTGDIISQIENIQGLKVVPLSEHFTTSKIEKRIAYANKESEIQAKDNIYKVITGDNLKLKLAEGRMINLSIAEARPLNQLGSVFWGRLILGALAVIMGALVWAWQPTRMAHILLFVSGVSLFVMTIPSAIEGIEMFITSARAYWLLDYITLIGTIIFLTSCSITLLYFPQKLPKTSLLLKIILSIFCCFTLFFLVNKWNPNLGFREQHLYATSGERYVAIITGYLIILALCIYQCFTPAKSR